jgi:hypothetical protein
MRSCELNLIASEPLSVAGGCEDNNVPIGCIKSGYIFIGCVTNLGFRKTLYHRITNLIM